MFYVLTRNLVLPAGTVFQTDDRLGAPGVSALPDSEEDLLLQVFLGSTKALEQGALVPVRAPRGQTVLRLVEDD